MAHAPTGHILASATDCGVCGAELTYATEPMLRTGDLCGAEQATLIACPEVL